MDPKLRQSIEALLEIYDGNRSKVAKILHVSRHTVAEIADGEDTDNSDEHPGRGNEMKHEMDMLEKENQAIRDEIIDIKSENERLIEKSAKVWQQRQHQQRQNSISPELALAQDILCEMIADGKLSPSCFKHIDVR